MRYAIIDTATRTVTNVCVWNGADWTPPEGSIVMQSDTANIGDTFDVATGTFTPTPLP
jgi:hypothetical protein